MRRWITMLVLLTAILLAGCGNGQGQSGSESSSGAEAGVYQIYYLNPSMTRLVAQEYRTESTDTSVLIEELMNQFRNVPATVDNQAALTEQVVFQNYKQQDMVLYLYFDHNYTSMKSYREILCRAALARTMTQIPGINYINIYSGDQPLLDMNGAPVGMLSAADFVDGIGDVNAFERTELTLYFTDDTGEKLYAETREVVHNINTSVERLVLEELISGPEQEGLMPTLDPKTKILNVAVNENVCYINFDDAFLSNPLEVKEYIPIYSIVNSLSAQASVSRVQITVNGVQDVSFRDLILLNTMFERNLDYIAE